MTSRAWCGLIALVTLCAPAGAQDLDEDFQVWAPTVVQLDIGPKVLRGWLEVQPRFEADAGRLGLVLWRPALGVHVTDWLTVWGGYAWVERFNRSYAGEHRAWEQVQATGAVDEAGRVKLLGRLRLEQRLREGLDPVAHRLRLLLRAQVALGDPEPPSLHVIGWNEVFVGLNTTEWGPTSGFDRNRSFVGLGLQLVKQLRVEAGYLFEVVHVRGSADELGNHVLLVSLSIDLP